jgi:hypothetical protein
MIPLIRMNRHAVIFASAALLAGCTASALTSAAGDITTATNAANTAIAAWPAIKGILEVAEDADPALAAPLAAGIALGDSAVSKLQVDIAAANVTASAILAEAQAITMQAQQLVTLAAPAIKVVPSST